MKAIKEKRFFSISKLCDFAQYITDDPTRNTQGIVSVSCTDDGKGIVQLEMFPVDYDRAVKRMKDPEPEAA